MIHLSPILNQLIMILYQIYQVFLGVPVDEEVGGDVFSCFAVCLVLISLILGLRVNCAVVFFSELRCMAISISNL